MARILAGQRASADRLNYAHPFVVEYQAITSNTGSATSETVWVTTASVTFKSGRAYRITAKALIQGNTADKATLRVRKTNTSGSVYLDTFHQGIQVTGSNTLIYAANICANNSGADVTAALVGTFTRSSGSAASVLIAASSTHVAYVLVEDVGESSDFPSATAIT